MKNRKPGIALVEVIIAFGVAVFSVLALTQVANKSVANSGVAKRQAVATSLAGEGLEWVRKQRSVVGWGAFSGRTGVFCLNDIDSGVTWTNVPAGNCGTGTLGSTEYKRYVQTSLSAGEVEAVVSVEWQEGSRTATSIQTSIFTAY